MDYEGNWRFHQKIQEVQGLRAPDPRQPAILAFFKEKNLLKKGMSVLDLGSAAGSMLKLVKHELDGLGGHGILTGVELTPGWVEAGNAALRPDATILEGDATDFTFALPASSYDFVMMNDSMEHIITSRYACLFERLKKYTSPGSLVYMHVPSPETQLDDQHQHARPRRHLSLSSTRRPFGLILAALDRARRPRSSAEDASTDARHPRRYFENVVPPHVVVRGMAVYGFELVHFGQDTRTMHGIKNARGTYRRPRRNLPSTNTFSAVRNIHVTAAAPPRPASTEGTSQVQIRRRAVFPPVHDRRVCDGATCGPRVAARVRGAAGPDASSAEVTWHSIYLDTLMARSISAHVEDARRVLGRDSRLGAGPLHMS